MSHTRAALTIMGMAWGAALLCALVVTFGGHTPSASTPGPAPVVSAKMSTCEAPEGAMFNPCATLDSTQVQDRRPALDCGAVVSRIYATQNYTGSAAEQACVGLEDDYRVALALDYGMTPDQYAAAERGESQT